MKADKEPERWIDRQTNRYRETELKLFFWEVVLHRLKPFALPISP